MKDNIDKSLVSEHIGETVNIGGMEFKIEEFGSIEHKNQIIKALEENKYQPKVVRTNI